MLALFLASATVDAPRAECGSAGIDVVGSEEEQGIACAAVGRVREYLESAGFSPELRVRFVFRDAVEVMLGDGSGLPVLGSYDAASGLLQLKRWTADAPDPLPWGVPWSRDLVLSVATHEVAHAGLRAVLEGEGGDLGHAWHEFVAYVVQFEVMDEAMRTSILDRFAVVEGFASPDNVNSVTLGLDPALFGLRAYLFAQAQGGPDFVARVISGDVDFATGESGPMGL